MRYRRFAICGVLAVLGCGHHHDPSGTAAGSAGSGSTAAARPATPASPGPAQPAAPAALPAPHDLLAAVPADTPFVLIARAPLAQLWTRVAAVIDPAALREYATLETSGIAPRARLEGAAWLELADALASPDPARRLGISTGARFVVYGVGLVPVGRIELADAAAAQAAVERAVGRIGATRLAGAPAPTWVVGAGRDGMLVAIAGNQLVIASGPRDTLEHDAARLIGAAPSPLAPGDLDRFAADRGMIGPAVGWIDGARIAALAKVPGTLPALDALAPHCRDEVLDTATSAGRIAIGVDVSASGRLAFQASVPVDPATASSLSAAAAAAPSLPASLPGQPLLALAFTAPPASVAASWHARTARLQAACDASTPVASIPPPWSSLSAAALVLYRGTWHGLLPSNIDGYAALSAPALDPIVLALAKLLPPIGRVALRDGGDFIPVAADLQPVAPALALARRGSVLVGATGPEGRAHAGEYAVHGSAPLARVVIDFARLATPGPSGRVDDDRFFVAGTSLSDAGLAPSGMISELSLLATAGAHDVRAELGLQLAAPVRAHSAPDPRAVVREQCRKILWHALAATAPAVQKLGIVDGLDALQETYTSSIEADDAIRQCAKLDDRARACLLAAANPITDASRCAPGGADDYGESKVRLPPLISFFGVDPLRARLHPPTDDAAVRARLVGTWVRDDWMATETWTIDATGHLVETSVDKQGKQKTETSRFTIEARVAGELALHDGNGTSTEHFFMPDDHTLYARTSQDFAPNASEDRVLVPLGEGYLVRDHASCSVITREGLLVPATCTVLTKGTSHQLSVSFRPPCSGLRGDCASTALYRFFPGWIVSSDVLQSKPWVRH